jgi:NAD(P)-dependent dehydrogenase (short-subunit alcohol dehydrogenase family)
MKNIAIIGASGAIGLGFVENLLAQNEEVKIFAFAKSDLKISDDRVEIGKIDLEDEESIALAARKISESNLSLDLVIVASGVLHLPEFGPEKSLRELEMHKFEKIFAINCFGPALVMKHFLPLLKRDEKAVFAALSARVASISDNALGGWHSYRASKAALNMLIKNAAIEYLRRYKNSVIVALHPGSVDSKLSKPFHAGINHEIFSPNYSAQQMLNVLEGLSSKDSGKFFAFDGSEILP